VRFEHWPFLLLLLLVPLFHRWWMQRAKPPRVLYSLPIPARAAVSDPRKWLQAVRYLAFTCLIVALARPQTSYRQTERTVSGIDIMMVMDISASMNIEDLDDRARVDVAKATMESFIRGRQNDRIGFIAFSGEPLTLAPPTLDYGLVLKALKDIEIGSLKDGTAIGDGLSLAINRLRSSKARSRVIILLTDGDNNVGQVDPATAGELAAGYGLKVYTIAIGREGRVRMPIKRNGMTVAYQWFDNALNPELLQKIAELTGGRFYRVTDATALESVFSEINQLEKSDIKSTEKTRYDDQFQKPLELGVLLLLVERILASGWWRLAL
jgi:Ca-activated chloride channel family protein